MKKNLLFILFCLTACDKNLPEEALLRSFQEELQILTRYQNDYAGYMAYQVENFEKKQQETTVQIESINKNFMKLSDLDKNRYQKEWQEKFQPVIDEIYIKTRDILSHAQKNLTPVEEAKIQEWLIKLEFKQKQVSDVKLLPQFYHEPDVP